MNAKLKPSDILVRAAEMCLTERDRSGDHYYGCNAMSVLLGGRNKTKDPELRADGTNLPYRRSLRAMRYLDLMQPDPTIDLDVRGNAISFSPYGQGYFGRPFYEDCQNHRVLSLCLAATIAADEGM
jgi:hypothetical protein